MKSETVNVGPKRMKKERKKERKREKEEKKSRRWPTATGKSRFGQKETRQAKPVIEVGRRSKVSAVFYLK